MTDDYDGFEIQEPDNEIDRLSDQFFRLLKSGGKQNSAPRQQLINELSAMCPGCFFTVSEDEQSIHIDEFGRPFIVSLDETGQTADEWFGAEILHQLERQSDPETMATQRARIAELLIEGRGL